MGYCYKLFIYTNNQLAKSWTSMIIKYLEQKQNTPKLFDQLICAFKINDVVIEPKRTTHEKTYSDFIKCSLLPHSSEICFIDDKFFKSMAQDKVYYIQPKPYRHSLTISDIIRRLKLSCVWSNNIEFHNISKSTNDPRVSSKSNTITLFCDFLTVLTFTKCLPL